jgi:tRNA nucleotidyltransferase/poly(A) polymerase
MKAFALQVVNRLREAGFTALWAGGCVRDMLLGTTPHDYDVASDATPPQVRKLFRRTLAVGAQFGVIEVLGNEPNLHVQVATFRSDGSYSDGRHPDSVKYGTPEDDAIRRDFTINGLFYDPIKEEVIDYVGGQADLKQRIVRAIGDPKQRFEEDKLRMLRAIRFVSRLAFDLDTSTAQAIQQMHQQIKQVSAERITEELRKMLIHKERLKALHYLTQLNLLQTLLSEFAWPGEITADKPFEFRLVHNLPPESSFPLAWAAMLLDVKRQLRASQPLQKSELQDPLGSQFKLSNAEIAHVQYLVLHLDEVQKAHQLPWAQLKPLLAHPQRDDLLALLNAHALGLHEPRDGYEYCLQRIQQWSANDLQPPVLVTGADVAQLGIRPGPRFKELLDEVRTQQLNETITNREEALKLLRRLAVVSY